MNVMVPRLLVIAGSDSSGGAGIQADIKTAQSFGVYAQTAITAVTVQNTLGVTGAHIVPPTIVRDQIIACLSDIGADAIKTGMLGDAPTIDAVALVLAEKGRGIPLILDPVMVAKGGASLLDAGAVGALTARLLPLAFLVTPNLPEAEVLTGRSLKTPDDMEAAARALIGMGARAALVKGGHLPGAEVVE